MAPAEVEQVGRPEVHGDAEVEPVVAQVADFLDRVTEPALRPIRRILPNLGGIDVSPIILILLLYFLRNLIFEIFGSVGVARI